jgi:two-component system, OmpR family, sensor histidine kinase MprB
VSLRVKFAIAMVLLSAAATVAVGSVGYFSTSRELRQQIDRSLGDAARSLPPNLGGRPNRPGPGGDDDVIPRNFTQILVQLIDRDGDVLRQPASGELPVTNTDIAVAAREAASAIRRDVTLDGEKYRMLTVATNNGAVQLARSLEETDGVLDRIRTRTVVIVVLMSLLALGVGLFIAERVTRRLMRLTDVATGVAKSGNLNVNVPVEGRDEAGKLGQAFSAMLASLARSRREQHQLVQDASHELKTPLTSLRTNVTVLQRFEELPAESRQQLLADLDSETRELTALVDELVELATERRDDEQAIPVSMGETASLVVERAVRRSGRAITLQADESRVLCRPQALTRAMTNLVENAVKFSERPIEVVVERGRFEVRDRGPGLSGEDETRIFDRFYRSVNARSLPGSGLGLSIVRDMAQFHGGEVFAHSRDGGGAVIGFTLPLM